MTRPPKRQSRRLTFTHYSPPPDSERILAIRLARRASRAIRRPAK